jgi:hypothetical protein
MKELEKYALVAEIVGAVAIVISLFYVGYQLQLNTNEHAPPSSFDELIRVTETGGHLVFTVRDDIYENHGFREKQDELEEQNQWILVEKSDKFRPFTIKESNLIARIFVYQVI